VLKRILGIFLVLSILITNFDVNDISRQFRKPIILQDLWVDSSSFLKQITAVSSTSVSMIVGTAWWP